MALAILVAGCEAPLSGHEGAYKRMRKVATSVPVTPGLALYPTDMVRTPDGNIFLASGPGASVRKVDATGAVTEIALEGYRLARDRKGRVYCWAWTEPEAGVFEIRPSGEVVGPIAKVSRGWGSQIAVDDRRNIYLSDGRLPDAAAVRIRADGQVTELFSRKKLASRSNNHAWRSFTGDSKGNLYFAADNFVAQVDASGRARTFAGNEAGLSDQPRDGIGEDARLARPQALKVDGMDNIYVLTIGIQKISPQRVVTTVLRSGCPKSDWVEAERAGCVTGLVDGSVANQILQINVFDVDDDGNIYFIDRSSNAIRKATPAGVLSTIVRGEFPARP